MSPTTWMACAPTQLARDGGGPVQPFEPAADQAGGEGIARADGVDHLRHRHAGDAPAALGGAPQRALGAEQSPPPWRRAAR